MFDDEYSNLTKKELHKRILMLEDTVRNMEEDIDNIVDSMRKFIALVFSFDIVVMVLCIYAVMMFK